MLKDLEKLFKRNTSKVLIDVKGLYSVDELRKQIFSGGVYKVYEACAAEFA